MKKNISIFSALLILCLALSTGCEGETKKKPITWDDSEADLESIFGKKKNTDEADNDGSDDLTGSDPGGSLTGGGIASDGIRVGGSNGTVVGGEAVAGSTFTGIIYDPNSKVCKTYPNYVGCGGTVPGGPRGGGSTSGTSGGDSTGTTTGSSSICDLLPGYRDCPEAGSTGDVRGGSSDSGSSEGMAGPEPISTGVNDNALWHLFTFDSGQEYMPGRRVIRIVNDLTNFGSVNELINSGNIVTGIRVSKTDAGLNNISSDILMPLNEVPNLIPPSRNQVTLCPGYWTPGYPTMLPPNSAFKNEYFINMDIMFAMNELAMAAFYETIASDPHEEFTAARRQFMIDDSNCQPAMLDVSANTIVDAAYDYGSFIDIVLKNESQAATYIFQIEFGYWYGNEITGVYNYEESWDLAAGSIGNHDYVHRYKKLVRDCNQNMVLKQARIQLDFAQDERVTAGLKLSNWVPDGEYYGKTGNVTLNNGSVVSLCQAFMGFH